MEQEFPWDLSVQYLKKVGPKRAILFRKLNIKTLEDLLLFLPFRYEDRTQIKKIAHLVPGEVQAVLGEIRAVSLIETHRRRMKIVEIEIADGTGVIGAKWFNQPYLKELFKKGDRVMISGVVRSNYYGGMHLEMESPQYEKVEAEEGIENLAPEASVPAAGVSSSQIHIGRIVPIYHETKGFTSRQIRLIVKSALDQYGKAIPERLPPKITKGYKFLSLSEAISEVHFPSKDASLSLLNSGRTLAHQRLAFDELFFLEMGLALRKKETATREVGITFNTASSLVTKLKEYLPFQLTAAQERVFAEIRKDMASVYPMHRLIQGDVGSGKTVVALMAILIAIENGYQAALMAPTEILAEQHFLSLARYFEMLGCSLLLLTSEMKKKQKTETFLKIKAGEVDLVIGTHALIQDAVCFKKLGLAVVDEQHKFGVLQRAKLSQKGVRPDILIMTATPIPRTLALTLYGDLSISVIDAIPPGRSPIRTRLFYGKDRNLAYLEVEKELRLGRQAYVVCPLIEESEAIDLRAAISLSVMLERDILPHRRIGLLHGRLKREEKERIMREFHKGQIDVLVSTTIVEVGIDLPNATVMVIEHAERFGLPQLHQLRGRVGRGSQQSICYLIAEYAQTDEAKKRLRVMQQTTDGFKIAEEDLLLRGPGEFFGTRQSGLPELKVANLIRDASILESARLEAFAWIEKDPNLNQPDSSSLRASLERKWKGKIEWLTVG